MKFYGLVFSEHSNTITLGKYFKHLWSNEHDELIRIKTFLQNMSEDLEGVIV